MQLIYKYFPNGGSQEPDPQVRDCEEISEFLGCIQLSVEGGHISQPRSSEKRKPVFDLEVNNFAVCGVPGGVLLCANDL